MFTAYSIEEAREIIRLNQSYSLQVDKINIENSLGRIISRDIVSECNVPGFRRSIMDGYAVKHSDLVNASECSKVELKLVGEVEMGRTAEVSISEGECAYIPTGGMLPEGADSVLIIENTTVMSKNTILAYEKTLIGENVVSEDEDIKKDTTILKKGKKIRPYEMGVLASIGCISLEVYKCLRIGILSTGDEIVSPYETPKMGQVRDINTYLLTGLVRECNCEPVIFNVKTDEYNEIFNTTKQAIAECDIVLIVGGSSMGIKDQTLRVLKGMENSQVLIHGLALKPGKPTIIAKCNNKMIFGMPGHPLSCAVVYKTLVKYYLDYIMNYREEEYPVLCELTNGYKKTKGREEYIPVVIEEKEGEFYATPIVGRSGIITTFSKAYGYFKTRKEQDNVLKGDRVLVYKL
jgi:molybdopterin molybdotransferase